jgi:hypothetical protein
MPILSMTLLAASLSLTAASPGPGAAFLEYWKSGLAELSSYSIVTDRYGESRKAQGVLVFVYEEINADTRIKVESDKTPPSKQIPVLKLNNVLKFNTGVYDYSVLTSVFAGLSGPGVTRPFEPRKISFTSQEWCGNVFHQVIPRPQGLVSEIHSYFEAEGDAVATLPYPKRPSGAGIATGPHAPVFYEDEMPILVRELDGEFLKAGEARKLDLLPGLWERRKRHIPLALTQAVLTKAPGTEKISTRLGEKEAVKWTLERDGVITVYRVEAAMPHHLLEWDDNKGEKGEIIASIRNGYWMHNHNVDAPLRKQLGLEYGVGEGR